MKFNLNVSVIIYHAKVCNGFYGLVCQLWCTCTPRGWVWTFSKTMFMNYDHEVRSVENPWLGVSYRPVRWCSAMRDTCHSYSFMQLDILLAILLAARWCFTWIYYIKITISLLEDDKQWKLWSIVQWYNHTKAASLNVLSTVLFTWPGSNTAPANIYLPKVDANPAIKRFKSLKVPVIASTLCTLSWTTIPWCKWDRNLVLTLIMLGLINWQCSVKTLRSANFNSKIHFRTIYVNLKDRDLWAALKRVRPE